MGHFAIVVSRTIGQTATIYLEATSKEQAEHKINCLIEQEELEEAYEYLMWENEEIFDGPELCQTVKVNKD